MGAPKLTGLAKDCGKAAKILHDFLEDGKIPRDIIAKAQGLAIFTGFRAGMYLAGGGGSGVVFARLADGTWSPPSAFSVRSGSIGLVYGVDVYNCVCVLNTRSAVDAYTKPELELGGAAELAVGPVGGTANTRGEPKPIWTYTKSRGLYGGLTVDGTVIKEKSDENAAFYGSSVTSVQILQGKVEPQEGDEVWPAGAGKLTAALETV
ncbi:related to YSC84 - protein involved in the organization of the actin cytoskeleton [Cephalotrichum gorgonifer]|uniref:Related to YSC84 - protein involved in the organization of the actin cytoskeleton n=1 Tax=Cephalotrichum gorgonifer TaxID=2041049 RepID=A0AAE8N2T0_9PEZI|nr:related to YSC84 - protein involved in the organization of the actin cytoskeleton [Cephalotrichum gorgonifer]